MLKLITLLALVPMACGFSTPSGFMPARLGAAPAATSRAAPLLAPSLASRQSSLTVPRMAVKGIDFPEVCALPPRLHEAVTYLGANFLQIHVMKW
jgi:hypothetical protein